MQIDTRLGSYSDIRNLVPAHGPLLDAMRAVVWDLDPEGVEVASPGDRSVWWGVGSGRTKDGYAYAMPHARYVNLGFFQGVHLPDPEGLLEGTGRVLRHVKLRKVEEASQPVVRDLILAARDERRSANQDKRDMQ